VGKDALVGETGLYRISFVVVHGDGVTGGSALRPGLFRGGKLSTALQSARADEGWW
jgi:hypothetical protein